MLTSLFKKPKRYNLSDFDTFNKVISCQLREINSKMDNISLFLPQDLLLLLHLYTKNHHIFEHYYKLQYIA